MRVLLFEGDHWVSFVHMTDVIANTWKVSKPAVSSDRGLVSSQHYAASEAGAAVLSRGGNAIDAAIAAGLTLGTVEPWMSGIGGGGYMTLYLAATDEVKVVEFGMRAPFEATPDDYPLAPEGTNAAEAFNWPKVTGDTNIEGPLSIAVPGYLRGISLALETFGTWDWQDIIAPACEQAKLGLPIDWFSAQKINHWARVLNRFNETRRTYLADGLPPAANVDGTVARLKLGRLAETYEHLRVHGPGAYYAGELAESIVSDLQAAGSRITQRDFSDYEAAISAPLSTDYRDATLYVSGPLTAGPSIIHALEEMQSRYTPGARPDPQTYRAYIDALFSAYDHRLKHLCEGINCKEPGNTSHLCVADSEGNVVSLTQTIMSAFGSRIMLPGSGILMNNGMMWFDPRPGGPNSVVGGRKPLCNMCPVILRGKDRSITAIGACGGRKIFPSVFQLSSFLTDFDMTVEEAVHQGRIDVSGTDLVTVMDHLDDSIVASIQSSHAEVAVRPNGVSPNLFALPQVVQRNADGRMSGGCFIPSPHAKTAAAE
jgi:gamma-glutamyltranspeptidase/glutathione hydrolase